LLPPDPAVSAMVDASFYREKAEQALRLAKGINDLEAIKNLQEFARENLAHADALDSAARGTGPTNGR
jgi:hypothetical protein